jgi:hypothetical protein
VINTVFAAVNLPAKGYLFRRPARSGINCCLSSRTRMLSSQGRICCFLAWVACTRRGVAIAGRQWHLPINGLRSSNAAGHVHPAGAILVPGHVSIGVTAQ